MNCRRYGSKSSLGFWTLVLTADAASAMAGVGVSVVLLLLAFAALVTGGVVTARRFAENGGVVTARRFAENGVVSAEPATQVVSRRRG